MSFKVPRILLPAGAALVLMIVLLSAYSNTFTSPPTLDDFHSFVDEPLLQGRTMPRGGFSTLLQTKFGWTRYIPVLTFSMDLRVGGGELVYLHSTNFIIHLLCFLSVLFLVAQAARACQSRGSPVRETVPQPWMLGIWVAGLWALHPVQTNAVTYLVQRMASLVTLFYVFSLAAYVTARLHHRQNGRVNADAAFFYLLCAFGMALAALSKENSAMLPVMVLLTEMWFFRPDAFSRLVRFCLRHYLLSLAAAAIAGFAFYKMVPEVMAGYDTRPFSLGERLLTEARVVVWYVSLLLYPAPGRMSLEYDFQISRSLFYPLTTLPAIIALVLPLAWAVWRRRDFPLTSYGILWFYVNLLMESSVIPLELVFEHRLYLPSIGFALSCIVPFYGLTHKILCRKISARELASVNWCIVAVVASALAFATFMRNETWRDTVTLNRDNAAKAPTSPRAHANLASALAGAKRFLSAIEEAHRAVGLTRYRFEQYCVATNTVVLSYLRLNEPGKAVEEGEKLLKGFSPDFNIMPLPGLYMNMSTAYHRKKDYSKAFEACRKGIEVNLYHSKKVIDSELGIAAAQILSNILVESVHMDIDLDGDGKADPGYLSATAWAGKCLYDLGERRAAKIFLAERTATHPEDIDAVLILEAARKWDEVDLVQKEKWGFHRKYLGHPFSLFNFNMGVALLICERNFPPPLSTLGEACLDYAIKLKPDSSDAYLLKGWYHHARGQYEEALAEGTRAVDLDHESAKAWLGLAFFQSSLNRRGEAISSFQRALDIYPGCPERKTIRDIVATLKGRQAG